MTTPTRACRGLLDRTPPRAALTGLLLLATFAAGGWIYHARTSTGPPVATDQVHLGLNDFRPDAIRVTAGTTVTWHWNGHTHDLVFDDGEEVLPRAAGTYQRTFVTVGTYPYRCTLHGPMRGDVHVATLDEP